MHDAVLDYVKQNLPAGELRVLDFGGRDVNGTCRSLTRGRCTRYVSVDLRPGLSVDLVGDAATITVDGPFNVVLCTELFEHADDDTCQAIVRNAFAHLLDGGTFIATMAGPGRQAHSAIEATSLQPGEFYRNVTEADLDGWLRSAGFGTWSIDTHKQDIRCTATR